jgi:hypothetical protein
MVLRLIGEEDSGLVYERIGLLRYREPAGASVGHWKDWFDMSKVAMDAVVKIV